MGLLGYMFSRSTISIVLGVAPGLATLLLGTLSLKFWRSGKSSVLFILAQAGGMSLYYLCITVHLICNHFQPYCKHCLTTCCTSVFAAISAFLAWKYSHAYFLVTFPTLIHFFQSRRTWISLLKHNEITVFIFPTPWSVPSTPSLGNTPYWLFVAQEGYKHFLMASL